MEELFGSDSESDLATSVNCSPSKASNENEVAELCATEDPQKAEHNCAVISKNNHIYSVESDDEMESAIKSSNDEFPNFGITSQQLSSSETSLAISDNEKRYNSNAGSIGGESDNEEVHPTQMDVFGDSLDDISADSNSEEVESREMKENNETGEVDNIPMEIPSEDEDSEEIHIMNVRIPRVKVNLGKEIHFVKLPTFLNIESKPFDPTFYHDELSDEEITDEDAKARLKMKVENTLRWRMKEIEKDVYVKESNARIVRWSDGSYSFHLGNEIYDVYKTNIFGDHNHLFIRQGTGLQGQSLFRTKLTFRPHSTDSLSHRKMTLSIGRKSGISQQKIRILTTAGKNPDINRIEMIKKEEQKLRAEERRRNAQLRQRERATNKLTANYLEDNYNGSSGSEAGENTASINAIKKKYKKLRKEGRYSVNSDSESDTDRRRSKASIIYNSEDDDDEDETKSEHNDNDENNIVESGHENYRD